MVYFDGATKVRTLEVQYIPPVSASQTKFRPKQTCGGIPSKKMSQAVHVQYEPNVHRSGRKQRTAIKSLGRLSRH